jgi:hypothetical protein
MKSRVRYWFDTFKHLKSFDIIPYQDVVDLYLKNQSLLEENKFEKLGGDNERPINSDIEKVDNKGFWGGYSPRYYNIDPHGNKLTQAKADVVSMDMKGLGKTWTHFVYLEIPFELFNNHQVSVFSNDNIEPYREFLNDIDKTDLSKEKVDTLIQEYDKKYPETSYMNTMFRSYQTKDWSKDLEVSQYITLKQNGIIYPICYNSSKYAFLRGSHRSFFLAHTKSDVPIFLQCPMLNGKIPKGEWEVKFEKHFDKTIIMKVNLREKYLKFYKEVL